MITSCRCKQRKRTRYGVYTLQYYSFGDHSKYAQGTPRPARSRLQATSRVPETDSKLQGDTFARFIGNLGF
jgi:hypothetical protein